MNELKRGLEQKVATNFDRACAMAASTTQKKMTMDELKAMDCMNSSMITLTVTNGNAFTANLVLGTPVGNPNVVTVSRTPAGESF